MTRLQELRDLNKRWVRGVVALLFLGIAYGFASLAIDSGSLLEYAATLIFLGYGIASGTRAIRPQVTRGLTLEKDR